MKPLIFLAAFLSGCGAYDTGYTYPDPTYCDSIVQQPPHAAYIFGSNGDTSIIAPMPYGGARIYGSNGQTAIVTY